MTLTHRDTELLELMDDPACDPVKLQRTLRRFRIINRLVSRWGAVYRSHLRPVLAQHAAEAQWVGAPPHPRPAQLLDIGTGGGDVLRHLVGLARRDGFRVEALGIDPEPRAIAVANRHSQAGLTFRQTDSNTLVREGKRFDIVISNHLLHHLSHEHFASVVSDSERLATRLCVHSDIARGRLAYLAFTVGVTPLAPGTFLRTDGLRSIRRSYRFSELATRLDDEWRVEYSGPFRLLAIREVPAP